MKTRRRSIGSSPIDGSARRTSLLSRRQSSIHHRVHVVPGDLPRRGVPDIAEALDAAQRFVEILYAVRHAHQPGMNRKAEHLAAFMVKQLEGLADQVGIARRR